jgi:hypothetical protein
MNVSSTTFKNIYNNGTSASLGLLMYFEDITLNAVNTSFVNISGPNGFKGGVIYIPDLYVDLNLIGCTFVNIDNGGDGGVIYTNTVDNYTITSCIFEQCSASNGSGGMLYINNTGIFTFISCKFMNNSAFSGGNDIHHSSDLSTSYNSSNFVQTCSLSESPRVAFPDNVTLDNLLLGILFYFILFCFFLFYFFYFYSFFFFVECVTGQYYVATNGSDSSSDCSNISTPCQSITQIFSLPGFEFSVYLLYDTLTYKSDATNIGSRVLNLLSNDSSPTSVSFTATASSSVPLFALSTGTLYGHDLKFLYDSSAVDTFISLTGAGSVIMEYITITASDSSATVAPNPFITVSGGVVQLTQFVFGNFSTSSNVIVIEGVNTLLLDEINVENVNLTGSGSLVYGSGQTSSAGSIDLINSNISSISGAASNGSVININGFVRNISIYNTVLQSLSGVANGGAFYILNCASIVVNGSTFIGCATGTGGNGGAVYFGVGTSFVLIDSSFSNCIASYGGAIFTGSEVGGLRQIINVTFSNNSVETDGNGNDIADNSTIGVSLYGMHSVINSLSNSTSSDTVSNFYIIQHNLNFDCLLTESGCGNDPTFVSTTGVDSEACGSSASPCHSLSQGVQNLIDLYDPEAEISVASGDYTDTAFAVYSIRLTVSTNSATRPSFSLVSPPIGLLKSLFYIYVYIYVCI